MQRFIFIYLGAFVAANLLVKHYGAPGLWISSALLIPFDFICRCLFHEKWAKQQLVLRLFLLTIISGILTVIINNDSKFIALGSICGFTAAQISSGLFYQYNKRKSFFVKVNGSDFIGIVFDSVVFQYIAFASINPLITAGQIVVKFAGGLIWYFILFKLLKVQNGKLFNSSRSILQSTRRRADDGNSGSVS